MRSTPTHGRPWRERSALSGLWAAAMSFAPGAAALAHGELTGMQDVVQDYGVLLFLVATILIGAGVLAWVTFSPQADEADAADQSSATSDDQARDAVAGRQ